MAACEAMNTRVDTCPGQLTASMQFTHNRDVHRRSGIQQRHSHVPHTSSHKPARRSGHREDAASWLFYRSFRQVMPARQAIPAKLCNSRPFDNDVIMRIYLGLQHLRICLACRIDMSSVSVRHAVSHSIESAEFIIHSDILSQYYIGNARDSPKLMDLYFMHWSGGRRVPCLPGEFVHCANHHCLICWWSSACVVKRELR